MGVCPNFHGAIRVFMSPGGHQHRTHANHLHLSFNTTNDGSQVSDAVNLKQLTFALGICNRASRSGGNLQATGPSYQISNSHLAEFVASVVGVGVEGRWL